MHLIVLIKTKNKRFSNCLFLSLFNFLFIFYCFFMFNCLNEENKRFTNYLSLYFSFNLLLLSLYINIKPSFNVRSAQNCDTCLCFLMQIYENVYLDSLLVRQLKRRGFICNELNCLNEEKQKVFKLFISLSLSNFLFIFSCFMFNCLDEENERFTNYLSLFFIFYFLLLSLYIIKYVKVEF